MPNNRLTVIAAAIAGPGHQAGSGHHHTKHGIAALLLGLGAFVLAWFQTGPRKRTEA